jgi:hypothetical protein
MWCQGKIVDFLREEKDTHVFVKIEWNDKYVRDGDSKVTKKQLKKTNWNPNTPIGGAWREVLYHKLMNSEYIFKGNSSKQPHQVSMCVALWEVWGQHTVEGGP